MSSKDRHVFALMPCSLALWEGDDGQTYATQMNTGLMGKRFGETVARDEHAMLDGILKDWDVRCARPWYYGR
ncbi:MAG TPA: hypothetical protein PLO37_09110 [Candidatus Hydrogenedentes bacterium]|nr:hypothetical protein [Candidatus Hydrogenedentota bacterium]